MEIDYGNQVDALEDHGFLFLIEPEERGRASEMVAPAVARAEEIAPLGVARLVADEGEEALAAGRQRARPYEPASPGPGPGRAGITAVAND